jgi:hypothetical protein
MVRRLGEWWDSPRNIMHAAIAIAGLSALLQVLMLLENRHVEPFASWVIAARKAVTGR